MGKGDSRIEGQNILPGRRRTDGAMVGIADGLAVPNKIYGTLYAQEGKDERLKRGLLESKLIDWDRVNQFTAIPDRYVSVMAEIWKCKNFKTGEDFKIPCFMNFMPQEMAANYPLPKLEGNVRVSSLDGSHMGVVCANWAHYDPEYRPVVQKMLELNPSFGVFVKNEEGEEELASMVLLAEYGGIGLLQTVPKFRRKGYASIALAFMTRALGENGIIPHGHIVFANKGSSQMFEKAGYKVHGVFTWVYVTK